jgi:ABC-2 type transport system permease protein
VIGANTTASLNVPAMLSAIVRFEWRFQTRRLPYVLAVLLMAFVPLATVITGFGPVASAINASYIVTETVGIVTLVSVFALPMLCVSAAVRDDEYRMRELVSARPVPRGLLLVGRFAGVLGAALAVMAVSLLVQATAPYLFSTPAERLAPFRMQPYVSAFLLLTVPNTLFCAALLYLVAAASRSTLATFVASIAIYAGYAVTAMMVDSPLMAGTRPATPELLARTALLDPFGLSAFFEQTRYWTPLERNTRAVVLQGNMLWNRLLVLGLSGLFLLPMAWLDQRHALSRPRRRWFGPRFSASRADRMPRPPAPQVSAAVMTADVPQRATSTPFTALPPSQSTFLATLHATTTLETRLIVRSWPLRALLVLWMAMIAIEAQGQLAGGEYGTRMLASSAVLADAVPIGLWLIGTLCALYFAADAVGREAIIRFDGIRDATPASNSSFLLGKLLALLLIPVMLTIAGYGTVVIVHLLADGLPIEPRVYVAHALTSLLPLFITTVIAVALQVLTGNRWLGLLVGLAAAFIAEDGEDIGLEHLLLRFGATPTLRWSDLDGFGSAWPSWVAFNLTWTLGALTLIVVASSLWPRGLTLPLSARWRAASRALWSGRSRNLGLMATGGAFVAAYGFMGWKTVSVAQWESRDAGLAWRADYERTYRRLQHAAQPEIIDVQLDVALAPERRRATVRGTVRIDNRTSHAIDTVWIMFPQGSSEGHVTSTDVRNVPTDHELGMSTLVLPTSLAPGAQRTLDYVLTLDRGTIRADDFEEDVAENGTFIRSSDLLPSIGYQGRYEIADPAERARRGLGAATPMLAPLHDADAMIAATRTQGHSPAWFTVRTTISTSADQTAHGPGDLVREWEADGRRHFEYRLDRPSTPMFAITSGRYAVERQRLNDVDIELWYHAAHGVHAQRIVQIAARSLETLQRHFGRYPLRTLRLIEVPASWGFGAYAQTGSIYLTESRGMLSDAREGDVDLLVRRIGHEVAHEWWGHTVDPLWVEGRLSIVESLAKYSEQLLLDDAQGSAILAEMMSFDHDRYLSGRANVTGLEPTLLTNADDAHLYYGKGALAFHALREILGDSAILGALRTLLREDSGPRGAATAARMYTLLLERAPDDAARAAVTEWFTDRVIYDLVADTGTVQRAGSGTHVTAQFRVTRVRTDSMGEHAEPADGTLVTVGVYGGPSERPALLARVPSRVVQGVARMDTTVTGAVTFVEIDPEIRMIDRDRSNNRVMLVPRLAHW